MIFLFLLGNMFYGLGEYIFHRNLHNSPKKKIDYDKYGYIHNVHHKENTSTTRHAIIESVCVLFVMSYADNNFTNGVLIGYVIYKLCHVVQHKKSVLIPNITGINGRKYHHCHHNSEFYEYNFGVTTLTYDYLFGTMNDEFKLNTFGKITGLFPILIPFAFKYGFVNNQL